MIDKEELIERIENTLTTRTVKELFKSIVDQCRDVPIPKPKRIGDIEEIIWDNDTEVGYNCGWNACLEEIAENANCSKEIEE